MCRQCLKSSNISWRFVEDIPEKSGEIAGNPGDIQVKEVVEYIEEDDANGNGDKITAGRVFFPGGGFFYFREGCNGFGNSGSNFDLGLNDLWGDFRAGGFETRP